MVAHGAFEVLALDVEGAQLSPVGEAHLAPAGDVVADLADRPDRVLQGEVADDHARILQHPEQDARGAHFQERGVLAHVRVPDDDVQAPEALGVRVRLVTGVDDGATARRGGRDTFPDVLGTLAQTEHRPAGGLEHLAGARVDLPAHKKRDKHLHEVGEVVPPAREVVLVAAIGVARRVGVVLEQVDNPADAFVAEPAFCRGDQAFQDALARFVMGDEVQDRVALGCGVLGVAADVEIEPGAVLQEDVAGAAPAHDTFEEVTGDLVRAQPPLAAKGAGNAVLIFDPEYPALHRGPR